jgi:hypothetical protein
VSSARSAPATRHAPNALTACLSPQAGCSERAGSDPHRTCPASPLQATCQLFLYQAALLRFDQPAADAAYAAATELLLRPELTEAAVDGAPQQLSFLRLLMCNKLLQVTSMLRQGRMAALAKVEGGAGEEAVPAVLQHVEATWADLARLEAEPATGSGSSGASRQCPVVSFHGVLCIRAALKST